MIVEYAKDVHYTHMLVSSTAPANAEDGMLKLPRPRKGEEALGDKTEEALKAFRSSIDEFLAGQVERLCHTANALPSERSEVSAGMLAQKLKLVLNIHGYSTPLTDFRDRGYKISNTKIAKDVESKPIADYILFIDFSWPSEKAFSLSLCSSFRAMPTLLRVLLFVALGLITASITDIFDFVCSFASQSSTIEIDWDAAKGILRSAFAHSGTALLGVILTVLFLRCVTYFRDRERAASAGAYDVVELIRWMNNIFLERIALALNLKSDAVSRHMRLTSAVSPKSNISNKGGLIQLSILAHSMGAFVATQAVRTLSDVFDPSAIKRWEELSPNGDGPFALIDTKQTTVSNEGLGRIGDLFELSNLVLVAPDIAIWALTNGRSNQLQASLRRFREVFIFTNDTDIVLRSASTLANFFVFPSETRKGGYRLGNVVNLTTNKARRWDRHHSSLSDIGIHGFGKTIRLTQPPFRARKINAQKLSIIDCTDYQDHLVSNCKFMDGRGKTHSLPPRLSARTSSPRYIRYILTTMLFALKRLDPHGGYFQGIYCLDLIYHLLVHGAEESDSCFSEEKLNIHKISWADVID